MKISVGKKYWVATDGEVYQVKIIKRAYAPGEVWVVRPISWVNKYTGENLDTVLSDQELHLEKNTALHQALAYYLNAANKILMELRS